MPQYSNYKAFISYSHKDKVIGAKIFNALEKYKVPKNLVGSKTDVGIIPKKFGHFFRDRDELPAADDLTSEIRKALENSEFMIVICSPSAAASRWVNREILEFKKLKGEKRILSIMIDGEPFAAGKENQQSECFPPALRYKLGSNGKLSKSRAEPIAADLRVGGDGWHRAFMKLISGLLGVGLDTLIARDLQRKNRRVMAVTVASLVGMLVMAFLTNEAMDARTAADKSRGEAEGLIEFMLTDLRQKLEPVGRLDVLDAVGSKVVEYYDKQNLEDMNDDAIGRRAQSHHMLGEINNLQGNKSSAKLMFDKALAATSQLMLRDPGNPDRIFEHAQSVYWSASQKRMLGDYEGAFNDFSLYSSLAAMLVEKNPNDIDAIREAAYAESNMGTLLLMDMDRPADAMIAYENAKVGFKNVIKLDGDNDANLLDLADAYAWMADAQVYIGSIDQVIKTRIEQLEIFKPLMAGDKPNLKARGRSMMARKAIARYELQRGNVGLAISQGEQNLKEAQILVEHDADNMRWLERATRIKLALAHTYLVVGRDRDATLMVDDVEASLKRYYQSKDSGPIIRLRLDYPFFLIKAQLAYNDGNLKLARSISSELARSIDEELLKGKNLAPTIYLASSARLILAATFAREGAHEDARVLLEDSLMQLLKIKNNRLPKTDMLLLQYYHILRRDVLADAVKQSLTSRGYKPYEFIKFPGRAK